MTRRCRCGRLYVDTWDGRNVHQVLHLHAPTRGPLVLEGVIRLNHKLLDEAEGAR